ncbi:hypothetical protein IC006_2820 [Sulfuracidifex tepidarius]|uniref:Uncharacterized protein n=1 Tax=Sulfuracidifex tepidarius TaxID=1294262 RepID=A0A510DZ22_9CREN|nr:hypothetical protein IC006_2820 [Sulfuracidifex tepidarius]BBG28278.1 hypothetical protein IC007_2834 [Sulfuracidifex tepidarius]
MSIHTYSIIIADQFTSLTDIEDFVTIESLGLF